MQYGILKMGRISIVDDLGTVNRFFKKGNEDNAKYVARKAIKKIHVMWELGIIDAVQAEKFEHILRVYFERKYGFYA